MTIQKTNRPGLVRDALTGAILSEDHQGAELARSQRRQRREFLDLQQEVKRLRRDLESLRAKLALR